MSTANPQKSIAALIPAPIATPCGVMVRPLTLGAYALLERVKSPMITGEAAPVLETLSSLYILTHSGRHVLEHLCDIDALALEWAETLPPSAIRDIELAARRQIAAMLDVIADETGGKKSGHNGWIAAITQWAAETYGWSLGHILWDADASALMLMRRQWRYSNLPDAPAVHLSEMEMLDQLDTTTNNHE